MPPKHGESDDREARIGWRMAGIGFETASEVAAGAFIGWLIDRWQGTTPRWTMIGGIAGIAVGIFSLIRGTLKLNRELSGIESERFKRNPPTPLPPPPDDGGEGESDDADEFDKLWHDYQQHEQPPELDDDRRSE